MSLHIAKIPFDVLHLRDNIDFVLQVYKIAPEPWTPSSLDVTTTNPKDPFHQPDQTTKCRAVTSHQTCHRPGVENHPPRTCGYGPRSPTSNFVCLSLTYPVLTMLVEWTSISQSIPRPSQPYEILHTYLPVFCACCILGLGLAGSFAICLEG